jgi:hypothetical protein
MEEGGVVGMFSIHPHLVENGFVISGYLLATDLNFKRIHFVLILLK